MDPVITGAFSGERRRRSGRGSWGRDQRYRRRSALISVRSVVQLHSGPLIWKCQPGSGFRIPSRALSWAAGSAVSAHEPDFAISPAVRNPERLSPIDGMLTLKESCPLPAGPLSHAATVKLTKLPSWSRPIPSNSAPRLGSPQTFELVRKAWIPVAGSFALTVRVPGLPSG